MMEKSSVPFVDEAIMPERYELVCSLFVCGGHDLGNDWSVKSGLEEWKSKEVIVRMAPVPVSHYILIAEDFE